MVTGHELKYSFIATEATLKLNFKKKKNFMGYSDIKLGQYKKIS